MVLQRFNAMHEKEEAQRREAREARERALDEQEGTPLLLDDGGGGMAAGGGGSPDRRVSLRPEGGESPNAQPLPREPLARRRERQRRLAEEQRKRIAEEEREKQTADATIRKLQARRRPAWPPRPLALPSRPPTRLPRPSPRLSPRSPPYAQLELTHLLEANGKLRLKVEACEHNIAETSDAIEVHDASRTRRLARTDSHSSPRASLYRTWSSRRRRCARRRRTRSR